MNVEYTIMSKETLVRDSQLVENVDSFTFQEKPFYNFCKRLFDIVMSFIALIVLVPVFLIISLLIFLEDRHSPFFTQERCGKHGKSFRVYKFRTMCPETTNARATCSRAQSCRALASAARLLEEPCS